MPIIFRTNMQKSYWKLLEDSSPLLVFLTAHLFNRFSNNVPLHSSTIRTVFHSVLYSPLPTPPTFNNDYRKDLVVR